MLPANSSAEKSCNMQTPLMGVKQAPFWTRMRLTPAVVMSCRSIEQRCAFGVCQCGQGQIPLEGQLTSCACDAAHVLIGAFDMLPQEAPHWHAWRHAGFTLLLLCFLCSSFGVSHAETLTWHIDYDLITSCTDLPAWCFQKLPSM